MIDGLRAATAGRRLRVLTQIGNCPVLVQTKADSARCTYAIFSPVAAESPRNAKLLALLLTPFFIRALAHLADPGGRVLSERCNRTRCAIRQRRLDPVLTETKTCQASLWEGI